MIPAGKPPISLIALKFSTLFRQLQHHLWKSGETLAYQFIVEMWWPGMARFGRISPKQLQLPSLSYHQSWAVFYIC